VLWTERRPLIPGLPEASGGARRDALERAHRVAWAALSALPQASESVRRAGAWQGRAPQPLKALPRVHPALPSPLLPATLKRPTPAPPPLAAPCQELRQLLRCRLSAMAGTSTLDRLQLATSCLESARNMLAARVALKALNIGAS
jgi:hypothetical protein